MLDRYHLLNLKSNVIQQKVLLILLKRNNWYGCVELVAYPYNVFKNLSHVSTSNLESKKKNNVVPEFCE